MPKQRKVASRNRPLPRPTPYKRYSSLKHPPFSFLRLPPELQYEVLRLCLINPTAINIKTEMRYCCVNNSWRGGSLYGDVEVLTSKLPEYFNTNLLRTSSGIRQMAVPILYSKNTFAFRGFFSWGDFSAFNDRLSDVAPPPSDYLRKLELPFPELDHKLFRKSQLRKAEQDALPFMKGLSNLQSLTLCLTKDIATSDIDMLRTIRKNLRFLTRVFITVQSASDYSWKDPYREKEQKVVISPKVLDKMEKWGWQISGDWETFDEDAHLDNLLALIDEP